MPIREQPNQIPGSLPVALATLRRAILDPMLDARGLGQLAERYATQWLMQQGWRLVERNWHSRYGELDAIMMDPLRHVVVIEVKSRRTVQFGMPQEAVTAHKQRAIRRATSQWLITADIPPRHRGIRFDVVTITVSGGVVGIRHIPGAF